jgi:hypothetical protein
LLSIRLSDQPKPQSDKLLGQGESRPAATALLRVR